MPSTTVDLSSDSARAAPGQSPLEAGLSSMVTIAVAPPKQTLPLASEAAPASALGTVSTPRPLRKCHTLKYLILECECLLECVHLSIGFFENFLDFFSGNDSLFL
jgi:hypothetical protein